ncbi:hypothetical protein Dimus_001115 [Dionaea muscipula]
MKLMMDQQTLELLCPSCFHVDDANVLQLPILVVNRLHDAGFMLDSMLFNRWQTCAFHDDGENFLDRGKQWKLLGNLKFIVFISDVVRQTSFFIVQDDEQQLVSSSLSCIESTVGRLHHDSRHTASFLGEIVNVWFPWSMADDG